MNSPCYGKPDSVKQLTAPQYSSLPLPPRMKTISAHESGELQAWVKGFVNYDPDRGWSEECPETEPHLIKAPEQKSSRAYRLKGANS